MSNKFYITTPIYYVNDRPHIGHAYTTVAADVLARWHKSRGEKTFFLTGTDEHGIKVAQAADKNGKDVKDFVDANAQTFKDAWQKLNVQYDNFLRTTDTKHIKAVQAAVQALYDKGFIYKGEYEGLYCVSCEQYKFEDDLVDGKCREHNEKPVLMKEESYFFKLSQFEKILEQKISSDELKILPPERKNEILSFLKSGLKDISISRKNVKWGIPLPFETSQTIYVWVDAFLNYLTGLGWQGKAGEAPEFFPPEVQLMSKDILRVHATIWAALLLALELPLPRQIYVHGYFTIGSQKMSKSLGNVIWPEILVEKFGVDGVRYLLMSSLAWGQDGDVTMERFVEKYNADLANGLGNLISRVVTLNSKFKIQNSKLQSKIKNFDKLINELRFKEVLEGIWNYVAWANKYIEDKKLWELVKNKPEEGKKTLAELLSLIFEIGEALEPFLPETSQKIKEILASGKSEPLFPRV
ncbi:MAG: methionine--tRNA ligase [Candidatus Portnoybacteria bacterium RBG_19FT_COMBO_36_7]|uniref:Methionine--tRNA ligase n=1 Tax=Candidatus Portnoybacteria bacterium RBG_19FT_COMBO_36_7 TaxID=1801992 RepID=A0A1G2F5X0_9BACT|nr:MAG: methionine--tRNA ligase [Candidatus Portnoybacteria bacterium RBG_19FT_COMBO_36_7]